MGPKPTLSSLPTTCLNGQNPSLGHTYSVPHPYPSLPWPQSHSSPQSTHRLSPLQGHHGIHPFWLQTYSELEPTSRLPWLQTMFLSYGQPDLSPWSPCIPKQTGPKPTQGHSPLHSTCSHIRSWQQTYSEPDPSPKSTWTQSEWAPNLLRASNLSIVLLVTKVVFHEIDSEPDDLFWSQRWQSQ